MSQDSLSSFGPQPMGPPMGQMGSPMGPLGLGSQMQGPNLPQLGSLGPAGQVQSFGPSSDFVSPYGRPPYPYSDPSAGLYPGMSQYPLGQSQLMGSRRFGYGYGGLVGPPMGVMGPAVVGPPMVGPPMVGPPMVGPSMYPYGGYDVPLVW